MNTGDMYDGRAEPQSGGNLDIAGAISSILSNPAAMSMLSSVMAGARPPEPSATPPAIEANAEPAAPAAKYLSDLPMGGLGGRFDRKGSDRRSALLCALKPYVSRSRCETIDRLIGILAILELAGPLLGGAARK